MTYEIWLEQVKDALRSINIPMEDWQSIWPFDFWGEHDMGRRQTKQQWKRIAIFGISKTNPWIRTARKHPIVGCLGVHQGDCQPAYERGDYVKVEFPDETTGIGEWMWMVVDHTDKERVVYGVLDNEPVKDYGGKVKLGSQLAVSYDNVREQRRARGLKVNRTDHW
jgi:hypothetical protein